MATIESELAGELGQQWWTAFFRLAVSTETSDTVYERTGCTEFAVEVSQGP